MSGGFLPWLAGLRAERVRALARESRAAERREVVSAIESDERQFVDAMAVRARSPHISLGTTSTGRSYLVPVEELAGAFGHITAGTGSGKSRFICGLLDALVGLMLLGFAGLSIVLMDFKAETADLFLRTLAWRLQTATAKHRAAVLGRLITTRYFTGETLPEWNLLAPDGSADALTQGYALAETIEAAVGAPLGSRQVTAFGALLTLAIELGLTLIELRFLVHATARLQVLAARSRIAEVRHYVETRLPRERSVVDGIVSRLDALLRIQSIKAAVAGPGLLDLRRCFVPGTISVFDYGGSPLGSDEARRSMGALGISRLTSAVFDPARKQEGFTVVVCDELGEAVTPATTANISRLLVTSRSFGVGVLSLHQSVSQLPKETQILLSQNCRFRAVGRSGEADAREALEWLPKTGRVPRPALPGQRPNAIEFLSDSAEAAYRIAEVGRLPRQHFVIGDRAAPFKSRIVRAPDFDPPAWDALDPAIVAAVLKGSAGVARSDLLARARALEARVTPSGPLETEPASTYADVAGSPAAPRSPQTNRRRRAGASGPDVITTTPTQRGGDVP